MFYQNVYPKFDILRMKDGGKGVKNVCNITSISITMKEKNKTPWMEEEFSWIYFTVSTKFDFLSTKISLTAQCVGFNNKFQCLLHCIMFWKRKMLHIYCFTCDFVINLNGSWAQSKTFRSKIFRKVPAYNVVAKSNQFNRIFYI